MAGFNMVAVEKDGVGLCLHWDGELRRTSFGPGRHVISTNADLDDPAMPERRTFLRSFSENSAVPPEADLADFLRSHEGDRPVCKHGDVYGTVSSLMLIRSSHGERLLFADGPPCRAPFRDYTHLIG
ncbi:MAG: hypothetical protein HY716_12285 [Planctomycetes bacterium]|nr:hypothetical protein [Planctomycetota bacterium]